MESWEAQAKERTKGFEGLRLSTYRDSRGHPTIGYGHLLPPLGPHPQYITKEEAEALFEEDWRFHVIGAKRVIPGFDVLSDARKAAFADLCFNMGETKLETFHRTLKAAEEGKWVKCAAFLTQSAYASQVGRRAFENARLIAEGVYPA